MDEKRDMKKNRYYRAFMIFSISILLTGCKAEESPISPEINTEMQEEVVVQSESENEVDASVVQSEPDNVIYTSVADLKPKDVIPVEMLDLTDISGFFLSMEIVEGDEVYDRINGKSYQENDDIALSDLRYLKLLHYNYDGEIQVGEMIVNQRIEKDCLEIFQKLFEEEYPICRMVLIDNYWTGDSEETDGVSIKNNNTSSFNYRNIPGSTKRSKHALGLAIDLNPYENPYVPTVNGVSDYSALDETEYYYATNRKKTDAHVITKEDLAYKLFTEKGFTWGGNWNSLKDYQHFEKKE